MPRIRTIKPEFPQSESMGGVTRNARLTFILMWTLADDSGRLRGNSRMLASLLYPYDDDAPNEIDGWIHELEHGNCIDRYMVDGATYIQIHNWLNHQKIDKPSKSKIPPFDESSRILANPRECSSGDQGSKDLRIKGSKDQRIVGSGECEGGKNTKPGRSAPTPPKKLDFSSWPSIPSDQILADWIDMRKGKKARTSQTAVNQLAKHLHEASNAGYSVDDCLAECVLNNWTGFQLVWLENRKGGNGNNGARQQFKTKSQVNAELRAKAADDFVNDRFEDQPTDFLETSYARL